MGGSSGHRKRAHQATSDIALSSSNIPAMPSHLQVSCGLSGAAEITFAWFYAGGRTTCAYSMCC